MVPKTPFGQKWTFFQLANNGYHYPQTVNILRIFADFRELIVKKNGILYIKIQCNAKYH